VHWLEGRIAEEGFGRQEIHIAESHFVGDTGCKAEVDNLIGHTG
jgi:hypothetical protein